MMQELPTLQLLLRELQKVPYLASKNLYRVAHYFLSMEPQQMAQFCNLLTQAHQKLARCPLCFAWQEKDRSCMFCAAAHRNQRIICVVETWHDLFAIERTGSYKGVYHVLGGVLYPLEGIGPEQLTVEQLKQRLEIHGGDEIVLALNQTPEGEATAAYIAKKLEGLSIKITCLARGVPVGSTLEYMDRLTLHKAITERRLF